MMIESKNKSNTIYLIENEYFDFSHPKVKNFVEKYAVGKNPIEKVLNLYLAVRDLIRYNPYKITLKKETMTASYAVESGESYCIPKAALLCAGARLLGFPSRIGLVDVRNHLASSQLLQWLKTDYFAMHGFSEIFIHNKWVKATPAFNQELCKKFNVLPLEFDGIHDSVFQEYTADGIKHMEYLENHGHFETIPFDLIKREVARLYPHLMDLESNESNSSLEKDLDV